MTLAIGLGHALTKSLLLQPQTNVIATVRSVESGKILEKLAIHSTSKIVWICVEFDVETTASSLSAISELPKIYPWLSHIDTVVVNAGISDSPDKAIETPAAALYSHLAVNAVAPLALFQASWPLLKLAQCPRFVVLSSIVGSTQSVPETSAFGSLAYGVRKAALNYLVRKIGAENEGLAVMAIHPGYGALVSLLRPTLLKVHPLLFSLQSFEY